MKKITHSVGVVLGALIIPCLLGLFLWLLNTRIPQKITPATEQGRQKLRQVTQQGQTIAAALETYKRAHNNYPDTLDKLISTELPASAISKNWYYQEQGDTFLLYYKLDWDAGVRYEPLEPRHSRWVYDPGDGSQKTETLPR